MWSLGSLAAGRSKGGGGRTCGWWTACSLGDQREGSKTAKAGGGWREGGDGQAAMMASKPT